jgi:DNA repair protein RadA
LRKSDLDSEPKQQHHEDSLTNNSFFRTAADIEFSSRQQRRKQRLSTGSQHLDDLLSGGLETGEITQFYGAPNTGKTHLCHLLCVVLPSPFQVIYIDTEGTFRVEKIQSIAKARGLDLVNILQNIHVEQPKNSKEQELCIEGACSTVNKSNSKIKLLIVDSIIFHYKGEYPGRSGLAERAHRLSKYIYKLHHLAQTNDIALVITNHMTANPDASFEDPKPFGGNVISHASTYMINLKRRKQNSIDAKLIKSPLRGYVWHPLSIAESGFYDINFVDPSAGQSV